jgi:hypothetical protein
MIAPRIRACLPPLSLRWIFTAKLLIRLLENLPNSYGVTPTEILNNLVDNYSCYNKTYNLSLCSRFLLPV